jgi:predicted deacylase
VVFLSAAIHGDELNGVEIIHQLLGSISPRALKGTIIAVPVVNVLGFVNESRYLPDGRDLNRHFPGSARGSLASRIADLFMKNVAIQCELGIDYHTGTGHRGNVPQIRGNMDDPDVYSLTEVFAPPVALHARLRDGSLRGAASDDHRKILLFEGGQAHRFQHSVIQEGVDGTLRVLAHKGMIPEAPPPTHTTFWSRSAKWVRARRSGVLRLEAALGDTVQKGDIIGRIGSTSPGKSLRVLSPVTGVIIGIIRNPIINQGGPIANIAEEDPNGGVK